jgi:hypothetical protein
MGYKGLGKPSGDTTVIYQSARQNPAYNNPYPLTLYPPKKNSYESDKFSKIPLKFIISRYILISRYVFLKVRVLKRR